MIQHMLRAANISWNAGHFCRPASPKYLLKAPKSFDRRHLVLGWRLGSVLQVFILSGLRLENAAAEGPQSSLQAQPYQQTNQFLRFGIGVGLLLAIGLGQAGSCTCMQLCIRLLHTGQAPACTCSCASGCSAVWLL